MTVRLYLEDSFCRSFAAHVEATQRHDAGWEVALDRTCFYPTGGGQPADQGSLDGVRVLDVREEAGRIWHLVAELPTGTELRGEIDWARRLDHMQQHSGQHVLSALALARLGAQTVSFHLGEEIVTVDLDVADITPDRAQTLEDEANRLVMDDIAVRAYFVEPEQVTHLNLRKLPTKGERTRIVEVVGVDLSPCGGTHVSSTGQIGTIKVRRLERYKGGTRVEFLCGWRALRDYQWKHQAIMAMARDMSVADRDVEHTVHRLLAGEKDAQRQIEQMRAQLAGFEAADLRAAAPRVGSTAIVARTLGGRPAPEVKQLASILAGEPGSVALLAATEPAVRVFFMRSSDVTVDMRALLSEMTKKYGGGGGGRPETAEGGGMPPDQLAEALAWAESQVRVQLS